MVLKGRVLSQCDTPTGGLRVLDRFPVSTFLAALTGRDGGGGSGLRFIHSLWTTMWTKTGLKTNRGGARR